MISCPAIIVRPRTEKEGLQWKTMKKEDDDNYPEFPEYGDTFMGEAEGEAEGESKEEAHDEPADDLGRTIADARRDCETDKERVKLDRMLEDHKMSLYPKCKNGLKKLVTRVNSTNVLDEGLRIGEIGRRMNSKVRLVEIGVCRK
jgi:hypothetical protein